MLKSNNLLYHKNTKWIIIFQNLSLENYSSFQYYYMYKIFLTWSLNKLFDRNDSLDSKPLLFNLAIIKL